MNTQLFRFALEHLHSSDWEHFERLSSAFLASEYVSLRTMASPSGDGGRDSELFCPEGHSFIAAQYSVSKNWRDKIRHTVERLTPECPEVRLLLYLSSHQIGANADDLKKELLKQGIALDVRDQSWFIERATSDATRESAAEEIIARIARPYLAREKIINKSSSALSSKEARAALLYLGLQWQDDISGKGLKNSLSTHLCEQRCATQIQKHVVLAALFRSGLPRLFRPPRGQQWICTWMHR